MDIAKIERILNLFGIALIVATFVIIVVALGKAYRLSHDNPDYGCTTEKVIDGTCRLLDSKPVPKPIDL